MLCTGQDARDDRLYYKEARSLAKEHDVTIIAPSAHAGPLPSDDRITLIRLWHKPSKVSRALAAIRLVFSMRREDYDVLHIADSEMLPWCPFLRWRCKGKIVCDIWEANYELILGPGEKPGPLRRILAFLFRSMERWVTRRCDLVLTADEAIAETFRPQVQPTVIFNYPLLSVLAAQSGELADLQKRYENSRCLIYHGSMTEERGVLAAIEAMHHVRLAHPNAKLLLVGSIQGDLATRVAALLRRLELKEAVDLVGLVDHAEVGKYLAVSEIGLVPFAHTRKFEKNIPQKIFEYWAAGMPVVGTDLTPIRHYVSRCEGGLLTESNDPMVLAQAICSLLSQPETAKRMGMRGKAMVENEWRWEPMEEKLLAAYRALDKRSSVEQDTL